MTKKPSEPSEPTSWNVYKAVKKAARLGTVEAPDKAAAIEKAAQEFKAEAWAPVRGAAAMMQSGAEAPPYCRHANSAPSAIVTFSL
jgi:hypothetical protein